MSNRQNGPLTTPVKLIGRYLYWKDNVDSFSDFVLSIPFCQRRISSTHVFFMYCHVFHVSMQVHGMSKQSWFPIYEYEQRLAI